MSRVRYVFLRAYHAHPKPCANMYWLLVNLCAYASLILVAFNVGSYFILQAYPSLFRSQNLRKKVWAGAGVLIVGLLILRQQDMINGWVWKRCIPFLDHEDMILEFGNVPWFVVLFHVGRCFVHIQLCTCLESLGSVLKLGFKTFVAASTSCWHSRWFGVDDHVYDFHSIDWDIPEWKRCR